jgi:hypothetical protein
MGFFFISYIKVWNRRVPGAHLFRMARLRNTAFKVSTGHPNRALICSMFVMTTNLIICLSFLPQQPQFDLQC